MRKIIAVAVLTVVLTACGGSKTYRFEPDVHPENMTDLHTGCGIVQYYEKDAWGGRHWENLGRVCFVEESR